MIRLVQNTNMCNRRKNPQLFKNVLSKKRWDFPTTFDNNLLIVNNNTVELELVGT